MERLTTTSQMQLFDQDELIAFSHLDFNKGNAESALAKLKIVLQEDEPRLDAMSLAARIYAQIGMYERSQQWYQKVVEINPESQIDTFQLGMTYFDSGNPEVALDLWNKVLKQNPVHPPALFYKGLALAQKNILADAKLALNTIIQSAPVDNYYFSRANDLLDAINSGNFNDIKSEVHELEQVAPALSKDAYNVEH